jgi:hypothetical protein
MRINRGCEDLIILACDGERAITPDHERNYQAKGCGVQALQPDHQGDQDNRILIDLPSLQKTYLSISQVFDKMDHADSGCSQFLRQRSVVSHNQILLNIIYLNIISWGAADQIMPLLGLCHLKIR